jgi:Uncharacterised protein conserved in bacteria (DUF2336)
MANASHAVRTKLQAADPLMSDAIRNAVAEATAAIQSKTAAVSREYAAACAHVKSLHAARQLKEDTIAAFAEADQFEETTAALATLCELPIEVVERAIVQARAEAIMIIAKANPDARPRAGLRPRRFGRAPGFTRGHTSRQRRGNGSGLIAHGERRIWCL